MAVVYVQVPMPAHDIACPECGTEVHLPKIHNGRNAFCPVCHYQLASVPFNPYLSPIAFSSASLVFMFLALSFTFMGVKVGAASFNMNMPQAAVMLLREDYQFLAYVLLTTLLLTPALLLMGTLYTYYALYLKKNMPGLRQVIDLIIRIKPWVMVDIFIISVFVSMIKIKTLADMTFGFSFWAVCLLSLCIIRTSIFIHPHWLYYQLSLIKKPSFTPLPAEDHQPCHNCLFYNKKTANTCYICQRKLHRRKPHCMQISLALLIASAILYFPANTLPMMTTITPIIITAANIMEGIIYMWDHDAKFIGVVIFCASIMVPLTKMIALIVLLISARYRLLASPMILTKLYRIIEFIGRWSMIDVFVVTIMVTLVQLPGAFAVPGEAVLYFCLVVVLTMVAVTEFDIRLIWDKGNQQQND